MAYAVGDTVDSFTLPRAGGGEVTLDPAAAKATVVVWTCNHCPYALAWHDRLQAVARDYRDRGVRMLQINANDAQKYPRDSFEQMQERVSAGEFASDYLRDEEQALSKTWGARVTPDVFVLDATGRIVYRGAPDSDHDEPTENATWLRTALDEVLEGRPVSLPETKPRGCSVKWIINDQPNPYV
jgi:peroxiredoxin